MRKITLLLFAVVFSMSIFATRYLVQLGIGGAATWRTAGAGETLVDLTVEAKTLNAWLSANFATSFTEGDEIWLTAGTYQVAAIYNIPANFTIYGGFAGTETAVGQRAQGAKAWNFNNETIIDGNNAVAIFGCASNRTAMLDGITFTKGNVTGNAAALTARLGVVVKNSKFINNVASGQGGAVLMNGGGEIYDSYFYANAANLGGAVHIGGTGASLVSGCLFESNNATVGANKQGGAIRSQSTSAIIQNSVFLNNEASSNGSAIYTQVDTDKANKIINCVFIGNKTKSALYMRGAAMYNSSVLNNSGGGAYLATKDAQIYNSVFWAESKTNASVSGVNIVGIEFNNNGSIQIPVNDKWVSSNNIALDTLASEPNYPYFANPSTNDWQLTAQSPLLNGGDGNIAGVPTTDLAGTTRPQGAAYDIGAYELAYYNTTVTFSANGTVSSYTSGDIDSKPKGTQLAFTIIPNAGYKIGSVLYNGSEVKDLLVDGVYTAPALSANSTLVVQFDLATALQNAQTDFQCFTANNQVELRGLTQGEEVLVYNFAGSKVKSEKAINSALSITLPQGIYFVKVANQITKVIIR